MKFDSAKHHKMMTLEEVIKLRLEEIHQDNIKKLGEEKAQAILKEIEDMSRAHATEDNQQMKFNF